MKARLADHMVMSDAFAKWADANGLNVQWVFESPQVVVWRKLDDRENCVAEIAVPEGGKAKLHIKRYPTRGPARVESLGLKLLYKAKIPAASVAAWGWRADGRGFVITHDLEGYQPADKMIDAGRPFADLLEPTADIAAKLHRAGLHHRDLYLCHFMVKGRQIALIDAARVRKLPAWPMRRRWIVKDLAQFWYSTLKLPITDEQRVAWLERYSRGARVGEAGALRKAIVAKVRRISAHDVKLNERQPRRNISIPD
ncbi:MAG TPA: lipopolysaccharide kinase InaA family protein [Tepidisphaeraceae bacterium]|nr:lipopolysaccharide kinase InaA family protein [Tepidisphaeraceae bacterium]